MAITTISDFVIYNPQVQTGFTERLAQNVAVLNASSANTINTTVLSLIGNFKQDSFWKFVAATGRRDPTSTATLTPITVDRDENVSVKVRGHTGLYEITLDSLRAIGSSMEEASMALGQQIADVVTQDFVDTAIRSAVAAISGQVALVNDISGATNPATIGDLIDTVTKLGDRQGDIKAFVMHSGSFNQLFKEQGAGTGLSALDTVQGTTILTGTIAALGKPIIVTDSAPLLVAGDYFLLGLVENGVKITESETLQMANDINITGENTTALIKGEYAFNASVKGFKWDVTNGGSSPTDAALATSTNWDLNVTSIKDTAGVLLKHDS